MSPDESLKANTNIVRLLYIDEGGQTKSETTLHIDLLKLMSPALRGLALERKLEGLLGFEFNNDPTKKVCMWARKEPKANAPAVAAVSTEGEGQTDAP